MDRSGKLWDWIFPQCATEVSQSNSYSMTMKARAQGYKAGFSMFSEITTKNALDPQKD